MLKDLPLWKTYPLLDKKLRDELNVMSDAEIREAFSTDLSFGTGGLREIMGVGTNRLNIYTIRKATLGFANFLINKFEGQFKGNLRAVVSYDTRNNSRLFAEESARVLASRGFDVFIFASFRPTPELSFAVRDLHAMAGIMITASHNPPKYNGYKIYDEFGCQYVPSKVDPVIHEIESIESIFDLSPESFATYVEQGKIFFISEPFDLKYFSAIEKVSCQDVDKSKLKVIYTPLHGTGLVFGEKILKQRGFAVVSVPEQMVPDPDFRTVKSPNPEDPAAFSYAMSLGKKERAHILLATDPDADRMGVAVYNGHEYVCLTGNQTGAIILDYLTQFKKRPENPCVVTTIVTSDLGIKISKANGIKTMQTLTGFKFIGEQIELMKTANQEFFFGYEESFGYLISPAVRDKDSFQALLIICEIAAFYLAQGKTLLDHLNEIYQAHGFFGESLINIKLEGEDGLRKIDAIMDYFKKAAILNIAGLPVKAIEDYEDGTRKTTSGKKSKLALPRSPVLKFLFKDGGWVVFRPSGTEPKLKIYISIVGRSSDETNATIKNVESHIQQMMLERHLI